jgi:serine phosphatase RsbU (regulator of sigma subunit)
VLIRRTRGSGDAVGPAADDWLAAIAGGSEMGRAVRYFDWAATPLGPPATWPDGLRSAVTICLTTNFPALVVWGPQLTKIYNDGYRGILGTTKHPGALGATVEQVWPELWDYIGPLFDGVMRSGVPTWHEDECLIIERNGFPEECFFTFSYSPVFDGDEVGGVLDLVFETTGEIVARRRLECLTHLKEALAEAAQVTDACVFAVRSLAEHQEDVRTVDIFLRIEDEPVLLASNRRNKVSPADRIDLESVMDGDVIVIGGDGSGRSPARIVALPLGGTFAPLEGAAVFSLNEQRPFDAEFRQFAHLVVAAISGALDRAYRRSVEVGEYRHISDTLQAAMLPPASDLPTIAARYLPAAGNLAVGGDWYDVIDIDDHRRGLVVGDCVGHGLDAATVMAQLRSAGRAMLLDGRGPAEVLEGLDAFAAHVDGAGNATVMCVVYDRAERRLTYARAGHPPALLEDERGQRWLEDQGGPPLACVPGIVRTEATDEVRGDGLIVLYSDGLIERREEALDRGLERLAESLTAQEGESVQSIADGLLRDLKPENTRDDVVLVVKRL